MLQNSRGVFFEKNKSPCGMVIDHWVLGRIQQSMINDNITRYMFQKSRDVFFAGKNKPLRDERRARGGGLVVWQDPYSHIYKLIVSKSDKFQTSIFQKA